MKAASEVICIQALDRDLDWEMRRIFNVDSSTASSIARA